MMSNETLTVVTSRRGLLERVMFSTVSTVPCCVFLFINVTMLFTLRSKAVFCETSRYILLYNLLFADTVMLLYGEFMYIIAAFRITMTYPVCGVLIMFGNLAKTVSPVTLVLMSLERYVAVCYPLRHATIITIRNTGVAITVVWAFSSVHIIVRLLLLLNFPFEELESLQMTYFCGKENMLMDPISDLYEKYFTSFLFVSACLAVVCSYIGVMVAARSASTDKASARKARNTLLLHLVQLGLSLSSTIYNPLLFLISRSFGSVIIVRIHILIYVCIIILPRCLSALIYGLRDQTIRPVLMYNLCCRRTRSLSPSVVPSKTRSVLKAQM